jgi:hypothetical protein
MFRITVLFSVIFSKLRFFIRSIIFYNAAITLLLERNTFIFSVVMTGMTKYFDMSMTEVQRNLKLGPASSRIGTSVLPSIILLVLEKIKNICMDLLLMIFTTYVLISFNS